MIFVLPDSSLEIRLFRSSPFKVTLKVDLLRPALRRNSSCVRVPPFSSSRLITRRSILLKVTTITSGAEAAFAGAFCPSIKLSRCDTLCWSLKSINTATFTTRTRAINRAIVAARNTVSRATGSASIHTQTAPDSTPIVTMTRARSIHFHVLSEIGFTYSFLIDLIMIGCLQCLISSYEIHPASFIDR